MKTSAHFLVVSCRILLPSRITACGKRAGAAARLSYFAHGRAQFDECLIHISWTIAPFHQRSRSGPEDIQGRLGLWRRMKSENPTEQSMYVPIQL